MVHSSCQVTAKRLDEVTRHCFILNSHRLKQLGPTFTEHFVAVNNKDGPVKTLRSGFALPIP